MKRNQIITDADGRILVIVAIRLADDSGRSSKNVVGSPAVVIDDGTGHRRIGRQPEASVGNGRWFQTVNRCNDMLAVILSIFLKKDLMDLRSQRGGGPFHRPSMSQMRSPRPMSW